MTPTNKDPNLLDEALRNALRREEAPEGFMDNVLVRLTEQESPAHARRSNRFSVFSQPLVRWAAFAAVSVCLIFGGVRYRNLQRERARGEAAKQQLMLALRIAGNKLQLAKEKVHGINQPQHPQPRPARSRS
jgi:hypothetical protein